MPYFINCDLLQLPMTSAYYCTLFSCDQHVMKVSKFTQKCQFSVLLFMVQAFSILQHAKQKRLPKVCAFHSVFLAKSKASAEVKSSMFNGSLVGCTSAREKGLALGCRLRIPDFRGSGLATSLPSALCPT